MIRHPWISATIAAAAALALPAAAAETRERCYGITPAGENDGLGDAETPGTSRVDFQGDAWVWVAAGDCLTIALPVAADGTRRRGALEPLDRDRP